MQITSGTTLLGPNPPSNYLVQENVNDPTRFDDNTYQQFKLKISKVSKVDEADYACEVQDSNGNLQIQGQFVNTPEARPRLVVLYLPDRNRYPSCTVEEGTTDVKVGSKVNLRCTSEFGQPEVALTWKKSTAFGSNEDVGSSAERDGDELTLSVPTITISADSHDDIYTCFMKPNTTFFPNGLKTCDIRLNVVYNVPLPEITPPIQNAVTGDTVNFQCELPGVDGAEFTWYWEPNWEFRKFSESPDTSLLSILDVRSYHHLTKVYCRTFSQGEEVTVYGLIRVSGPYEEPPNTPAPSVIKPRPTKGGTGDDGTNGGSGGSNGGGGSPTVATGPEPTTKSGGHGIQAVNIKTVLICLCLCIALVQNVI